MSVSKDAGLTKILNKHCTGWWFQYWFQHFLIGWNQVLTSKDRKFAQK